MDYRSLAKALILTDGRIDQRAADLIVQEVLRDWVVTKDEVEFLVELRRDARNAPPDFDNQLLRLLKMVVLLDGVVSDEEARWLRTVLLADGVIRPHEAQFLESINQEAKRVGRTFMDLLRESRAVGR